MLLPSPIETKKEFHKKATRLIKYSHYLATQSFKLSSAIFFVILPHFL